MLDPFLGDGYSLTTLTDAINKLPNRYGRIKQLGIFRTVGVATRTIEIEEKNGVLVLVPTAPWGSPGAQSISGKRKLRTFSIPHTPLEDVVAASEVQGIRTFGSENGVDAVNQKIQEKLQSMRDKIEQTMEWRQMGALKGIIYDADGSSVLYNLYTEFGITPKVVDFVLGTAGTDVRAKCIEVKRHMEQHLFGERMTGIRVLVSSEFMDKLVSHATVKAAYANWQGAQQQFGGDLRAGFTYGGLVFEEYAATTTNSTGSASLYLAANDGIAFPEGTASMFEDYAAPADFNETVNTIGIPFYAKMETTEFNRGTKIHVQSNRLPLCKIPELLVRCHTSN
jgi:hypothetical protein